MTANWSGLHRPARFMKPLHLDQEALFLAPLRGAAACCPLIHPMLQEDAKDGELSFLFGHGA